ncbi:hypothetical protein FO013_19635, partial [Brevibacterium aurantiacum]
MSSVGKPSSSTWGQQSLFDQLKDSNLDLTGHPLAGKFESLAAVPTDDPRESNDRGQVSEDVEPAASALETSVSEASGSEASESSEANGSRETGGAN